MSDFRPDSDAETSSEILNSSQSSMSNDSYGSFSRLSFDSNEISSLKKQLAPFQDRLISSKPHRSSDSSWEAIRSAALRRETGLSHRDFKLIRQIGKGDTGTVYLCRLRDVGAGSGEGSFYAMKVVDKDALAKKKKIERAETEKRILRMLDHPFLPTLYAEFEASHLSCVVMEFCSGGDLHTLRHKHHGKRFPLSAARFYAAEVLLALEYLHMLGIIYRDLKPENILVRSDGHIMLSDFDLSLRSDVRPSINSPSGTPTASPRGTASHQASAGYSCIPFCLFRYPRARSNAPSGRRQFVAEPVDARSRSFVGTHEYVSPEVAAGGAHGNAVDWWAFGVLVYELIYGHTPFAGETNEATLRNIVRVPLAFPRPAGSGAEALARDLISRLLVKDPERRLGSRRGAAELKTHPFFAGLNFALIRSAPPPAVPSLRRARTCHSDRKRPRNIDFF